MFSLCSQVYYHEFQKFQNSFGHVPQGGTKIIALHLPRRARKKDWLSRHVGTLSFAQTNFRIAEQTLNFDFKNAWKILDNFNLSARSAEATNLKNFDFEKLRCLLVKILTFFDENPDSDF